MKTTEETVGALPSRLIGPDDAAIAQNATRASEARRPLPSPRSWFESAQMCATYEANARLHDAATDLLEALESVCALDVVYGREFRDRPEIVTARAVIARARGRK
jgi:hypothetical protein